MNVVRFFYWSALITLLFFILFIGKKLLIPFVLAIFIWYLINVLAEVIGKISLGKKRISPAISFLLALICITGFLGLLIQLITENIADVVKLAPQYQIQIKRILENFFIQWHIPEPPSWKQVLGTINIGSVLSQFAKGLTGFIGNAGIILIYLIFLFLEQKNMKKKISAFVSNNQQKEDVFKLIQQIDSDIRKYIGIKTFTSALTGLLSYFILSAVGLDFAVFWGIMIFIFNFIPTIGSIIATIFPSLLSLVQFESLAPFVIIAVGVTGLQFLIGNLLDPKLMGNSLNLSPLSIILSLLLWGAIWGVAGMLLCVPIIAIFMIIFSHFEKTRPLAILLSKDGMLKDPAAGDQKSDG